MKYVIIGNSTAAVGCIEGIRSVDKKGKITVVSSENHACYGRPLISYLLMGRTDMAHMNYRSADFYGKNGAALLAGRTAEKIDAKAKKVALSDGKTLSYDRLLVATGSRPFLPPMDGIENVAVRVPFMTLDDALALDALITKDSRVFIVGAGLIGMKCAEGIADRVAGVELCDMAPRALPAVLDEDGSRIIQSEMEKHNCVFHLGTSVKHFSAYSAELTNGETVGFDIVVTAVGVRPNAEIVKDAGGKVGRGISVDSGSRTSLPDVFAAGDCTEYRNAATGAEQIMAILPNAYFQGHAAGVNMAGGSESFETAIPMNAGGFFDLHMVTAGAYEGEVTADASDGNYRKLFVKDGVLKGFMIIGDIRRAGIYTSLIKNATPLAEVDTELMLKAPQLMAYGKDWRKKELGGVGK
jgi:NAD(P)H-nitrite reductase large subunit